jgi:2-dehydro-3-deoxygluconokinase
MDIDVVSFGESMLRFLPTNEDRIESSKAFQVYVAGSESNTLACLARLGMKTTWLSALPRNPLGKHIEAELLRHSVNTAHVVWMGEHERVGTFYTEEAPSPLGVQLYYDRSYSACTLVEPEKIPYSILKDARLLHLTGITPALSNNAREIFKRLLRVANEYQLPISFDVNYRSKLWSAAEAAVGIEEACRQASLLFCTRADAIKLWGLSGSPESILRGLEKRFVNKDEDKTIILTLGGDGAAQLEHGMFIYEAAFPTNGAMRFGSGDAFSAGYLYAYLGGTLYHDIRSEHQSTPLTLGNAFAALKRCIAGDIAVISQQDVRSFFQRGEDQHFR